MRPRADAADIDVFLYEQLHVRIELRRKPAPDHNLIDCDEPFDEVRRRPCAEGYGFFC